MADLSIYTGRENIGTIPNIEYGASDDLRGVFAEITASNSKAIQHTNALNMVLEPMEQITPRKEGTPLPIKVHNIKFTAGTIQTSAKEFRAYLDKFDLERSQGFNVMNFDYDDETILQSRNENINLNAKALDTLRTIRNTYINRYLPFSRLKSIITGTTQSDTVPTLDGGTTGLAGYKRSFGFARGEDYADFLTTTDGATTRNHYRALVGATYASSDITNMIDLIEDTNEYSGKGVIVLAHPRIVQQVALLANSLDNQDISIFGTVTEAFGAEWKKIPGMHKDFMIFLDKGYLEGIGSPLLVRGVEIDEQQRGLGIVMKDDLKAFKSVVDMGGSKSRIFPEEWYQGNRLAGGILDIKAGRGDASGVMIADSITALEAWVTTMNGNFKYSE